MLIPSLNRVVAKVFSQTNLRTVLIVPLILQIVGGVGLVGYLSFKNGEEAVNKVAAKLYSDISDRIVDRIKTYLKTPHLINKTNVDGIDLGQLNIKNSKTLERHFLKQIQVFDGVTSISFGNPQGGFISAGNDERGISVAFTENFARGSLRVEGIDRQGNRNNLLVNEPNYDVRVRPFYQSAIAAGKPIWSPIYIYVPSSRGLGISASYPLYDGGSKLQGVLSSHISLVAINEFLQDLKISVSGKAFIVERSGMIVASSTPEIPFVRSTSTDKQENKRLKATKSREPLIRYTAEYLMSKFGGFAHINTGTKIHFQVKGKQQIAQVTPFKDEFGLDWLIVVVVPESDFMEQINANTYMTIFLCGVTLVVTTWIGIITSRWITKPLLQLNTAAKEIAQGKWDKIVELKRSDEVGQLAKSFGSMAVQLQASFSELTALNEALAQSDRKFRGIFNQTFQFTGMLSLDGIILEVNQTAIDFCRLPPEDLIGKPIWQSYCWTISPETQTHLQESIKRASHGEFIRYEVDLLGHSNRMIAIDLSLKPIFDRNGKVEFIIIEGRDITEQKQAQKVLANYNHTLEEQVAKRTEELIEINQQTQEQAVALEIALDKVKRTQSQLIQAEKMSSLGLMVAGIAHEINNPVSFIYGNIAPARQYCKDLLSLISLYQETYPNSTPEIQQLSSEIEIDFLVEDWQKLIDSIEMGADRIRKIVLSLRNFSRLDEKELKAVDIHEGIDNTLMILQHRLRADGNRREIEVIKNYGELPLVTCYASQLNQVFMNLFSNAIDALENQSQPPKITIETSLSQNSLGDSIQMSLQSEKDKSLSSIPHWVIINISDNGAGMSEEVKEKIFDPFFTTKPIGSGTGLGLSISYQIVVEKHNGLITCLSAPGSGTEFMVKIPLELSCTLN
ncbi:HAMP domain-containing sensor histidine kinase [Limnofasciculus baicalensis]|uniref:histidine kinase n=1 Tax=Limnofasciculus baicalensis BBK-W-15 TaxID=2699891 RepID=A0AAE3GPF8_9CYAN|nr:ATP-binding protein [Limnofasciculus baicalensis]MCP2727581.1 ATP-binding protein [Limnofasciculus baicalensis BBK-W-15]